MQQITSLAYQVNDILSRYIVVHDAIFKFSIRKLLPISGLFKAIDYGSHHHELDDLHSDLADILVAIAEVQTSQPASSSREAFLVTLAEYADALSDPIAKLRDMCSHLYRKSQGATDYSWGAYRRDVKAYEASVQHYMASGEHLNSLWAQLREPSTASWYARGSSPTRRFWRRLRR